MLYDIFKKNPNIFDTAILKLQPLQTQVFTVNFSV